MDEKQLESIRRLFLFQVLNKEEIGEISVILQEKKFSAGERIFSEKDSGDSIYIVKEGSVKIFREKENKDLVTMKEGEFFGEIALFDYVLRTASAIAAEDTVVLEIHRKEFMEFISSRSAIGIKILFLIIQEMAKRLRRLNKQIDPPFLNQA